jgi:flavorubredoxin
MYNPAPPVVQAPYQVAAGTWVVPQLVPASPGTLAAINSMVIAGAEPVIVDTGARLNRSRWLEAVFSLVQPAEVRWIFLSHDDRDHVGNLAPVLEACPDATVVTTWQAIERLASEVRLPARRCLLVNDGESFTAGGRTLTAITPPVYDAPATRGLFDPATGVYWAADSFSTLLTHPVTDVAELDQEFWEQSLLLQGRAAAPWHTMLDPARYERHIRRSADLNPAVIAAGHAPAMHGPAVERAFRLIRQLPHLRAVPGPCQADLDSVLAALPPG